MGRLDRTIAILQTTKREIRDAKQDILRKH